MPPNPHDLFFKYIFSQPEAAASVLRALLAEALVARIDFKSLVPISGESVSDALVDRRADLLFRADLDGRPALIYLLLEHQSTVDPLMPLRVLAYALPAWLTYARQHGQPLPPLVPCVLYHGKDPWNAATTFEGLFDFEADPVLAKVLRPHTPHFALRFVDLNAMSDEATRLDAPDAAVALAMFKHVQRRDDIHEVLRDQAVNLRRLSADSGQGVLKAAITYIAQVNPRADLQAIQQVLHTEVGTEAEGAIMSTFQELFDRGRQEGEVIGARRLLRKLLRSKFDGDLSAENLSRIDAASLSEIEQWSERVLRATRLDEIFC